MSGKFRYSVNVSCTLPCLGKHQPSFFLLNVVRPLQETVEPDCSAGGLHRRQCSQLVPGKRIEVAVIDYLVIDRQRGVLRVILQCK